MATTHDFHRHLEKRLGTSNEGVPRILGVSIPLYRAFLNGDPEATSIVRSLASQFRGNERDFCGPYTVKRVISSGGFGEVGEVVNSKGQPFAAKVFKTNSEWGLPGRPKSKYYSPDSILEIDVLSRVHHPNVLSARMVGGEGGRRPTGRRPTGRRATAPKVSKNVRDETCVITDLGSSLDAALAAGYHRTKAAFEMACGLKYLHQNSIIHRDFKEANVLIVGTEAKIIDFGLVLNAEVFPVDAKGIAGTPGYIDPNLFFLNTTGKPILVGPEVDMYALGVVLAWVIFGVPTSNFYAMAGDAMAGHEAARVYLETLASEGFGVSDTQSAYLTRGSADPSYIARNANSELYAKYQKWEDVIMAMLSLNPLDRPTSEQAADFLGSLIPSASSRCVKSLMSYERVRIYPRGAFFLDTRRWALKVVMGLSPGLPTVGSSSDLPMLACTSDIFDRVCSVAPDSELATADLVLKWCFISKFLAYSVLGLGSGGSVGDLVADVDFDFERLWVTHLEGVKFGSNVEAALKGLNYRVFRPSIAEIFHMEKSRAVDYILTTFSPDYISWVPEK